MRQYGLCPLCGHKTYDLDRTAFCPCEDCHVGGHVVRDEAAPEPIRRGPGPRPSPKRVAVGSTPTAGAIFKETLWT